MNLELERYYNNYFSLFLTDGWKQFLQETKESREILDLDSCKDWETFLVRKTKRDYLLTLLNFEEGIKNAYDRVKESLEEEEQTYNDSL
jgi:hypothetical protein